MSVEITAVPVPADLLDVGDHPFVQMATVFNQAVMFDIGLDHLRWEPAEMLPDWHDESYRMHRGFLARDDSGRPVGALQLVAPCEDGATEIEFDVAVLPDARDGHIERQLLERLEHEARALGRSALQTYSIPRIDTDHQRLPSPSGFGSVPIDHHTRLFLDAGFTLAQVERNSRLDMTESHEGVRAMLDEAIRFAGPDYRIVTFSPPTPPLLRESFAFVLSRMSTDVPAGGLTITEETWDAERVDVRDARIAAAGLTVSVAAVEHLPSGRIVAYNDLGIGADRSRPTSQWGTLVVRGHRGHRLGTIVKCANILRWRELVPESPFISTFNAEENRPMLDVNERIGFTPLTVAGAWERRL